MNQPESPWTRGDGPLPSSIIDLIAEIKALAVLRRRDALTHTSGCACDGCKVRRIDQSREAMRRRAA